MSRFPKRQMSIVAGKLYYFVLTALIEFQQRRISGVVVQNDNPGKSARFQKSDQLQGDGKPVKIVDDDWNSGNLEEF